MDDECKASNSVASADSDISGGKSSEITVMHSTLDGMLHCQCNSVKLLGYPCVHIIRVASHMKQIKSIGTDQSYAVEYEDIKKYFANHLACNLDEDMLHFDLNNPITLDREKHYLTELLVNNG